MSGNISDLLVETLKCEVADHGTLVILSSAVLKITKVFSEKYCP